MEERGTWRADLFPFHCLLSEGREVSKNMAILTRSFFLSFLLDREQSRDTH